MEAWIWTGKVYRWYLDTRVSWDGHHYRVSGKFTSRRVAKQLILSSIGSTALLRLPAGGVNARVDARRGDILQEVSNNSRTKEEIEAEYAILSFHDDLVPEVISNDPLDDLERLGTWETEQAAEPWHQWGGSEFLISYYAILDRYVSKGNQYRGYVFENPMQPFLGTAYSELAYRLSEIDTNESPVHTVGIFIAFLATSQNQTPP